VTKHALKSKSVWLGLALAVLPQVTALTDYLTSSGAATWAVSIAGLLAVVLRYLTDSAVTLKPQAKRVDPVAFVIIAVLMVTSCATTCEVLTIKRQPWAEGGANAAKLVYKCGASTITHKVRQAPVCLDACFKKAD
jgi:hypothetical protein